MRCATIAPVLRFEPVPADTPPASDLIGAMVAEMALLYGPIDGPHMPSATPADFAAPHGTFLVGFDEHEAPACAGGVKRLDGDAAEIKRMYVVPSARGRGIARVLLAALEDAAREIGYRTVRLDTGPRQAHAQALYESAGYRPVGNFNANPVASFWGEKRLADPGASPTRRSPRPPP
jgi:GNAT superfamily N-acetyltransferase